MRVLIGAALTLSLSANMSIGQVPARVVSAELPTISEFALKAIISGDALATVTTDGSRVIKVEFQGHGAYREMVEASLATWRFEAHSPMTFDVAFHFTLGKPACVPHDVEATLRMPTEVTLFRERDLICDGTVVTNLDPLHLSIIAGTVLDEQRGTPISRATVILRTSNEREQPRTLQTGRDGSFDFGPVFEGRYEIEVQHGYQTTIWPVRVTNEIPQLVRAELRVTGFPRDPGRAPASALVTKMPTYPTEARRNGIDGVVLLRVMPPYGPSQAISVVSGHPLLAAPALENLRTWALHIDPDAPQFDVTYRYTLLSGDCAGNDGPFIELKPPTSVTVSMKRIVPCRQ